MQTITQSHHHHNPLSNPSIQNIRRAPLPLLFVFVIFLKTDTQNINPRDIISETKSAETDGTAGTEK